MEINYSDVIARRVAVNADGHMVETRPPRRLVNVRCRVKSVEIPFVNSPSIGGDDATAVFVPVESDGILGRAGLSRIVVHYHDAVLGSPFKAGEICTLLFTEDGQFYDFAWPGATTKEARWLRVDGQ